MLQTTPEGYYVLSSFAQLPHLVHAFSSRQFGSMNPRDPKGRERREQFFSLLGIPPQDVFSMHQVHSAIVQRVDKNQRTKVFERTDGLYTKEKGVYLVAITADCVPVIVYDRLTGYLGVVHAGWKGVFTEIVPTLIKKLQSEGSHVQSLLIGLGPSIRSCCYTIDEVSADSWKMKYPDIWSQFLAEDGEEVHLSLQGAIMEQLKLLGVTDAQIDDSNFCTKDHANEIFSYRAEGETQYMGEFLTVIGIV